ncbi:MAG TPA: hypothetical protein ENN05_07620 [Deltaproteobacteria bacterium]|nr:hypothetical protein [Deltaproteobacteria bacterium]
MPIIYSIHNNGHYIHAVISEPITSDEFIEYEIAHAIDSRISPPVFELLEIRQGSLNNITTDDISKVISRRKEIEQAPTPHRCAIVPSINDNHAWNMAKFYEGMVLLHYPENVIVFGDVRTAKMWLGVE